MKQLLGEQLCAGPQDSTRLPSIKMPATAKSLQSCPTLCDPIDGSPPGSTIPGILQARTLEWVTISFSSAWSKSESEVMQSCLTLSDPMDYSLPGSSVCGIFQARVPEWVAIAFSTEGIENLLIQNRRRRKWQPTPVFLPGESHGQRSLVGYSTWGCKESDMNEWLTQTHTHTHTHTFLW